MLNPIKNTQSGKFSTVKNLIECPHCCELQEIEWNYFPEDIRCTKCFHSIETEKFEPAVVIYKRPAK